MRKIRFRICSLLCVAALLVGMLPAAYARDFPTADSWALPHIQAMDDMKLLPSATQSRNMRGVIPRVELAEMAIKLYEMITFNYNLPPQGKTPFKDVDNRYATLCYELDIFTGFNDKTFRPNDPLLRRDCFCACLSVMNAMGYLYLDDSTIDLSKYDDGADVDDYARPATRLLISIGLLEPQDNKLRPDNAISCQDAISMLYRVYLYTMHLAQPEATDNRNETHRSEAQDLVAFAQQFIGSSYVWGGTSPSGFDCSGFVMYVYKNFGYNITRTCTTQINQGVEVAKDDLLPGDLVFFEGTYATSGPSHVGIYVGEGMFIHAANSQYGVIYSDLSSPYYSRHYLSSRRVIGV